MRKVLAQEEIDNLIRAAHFSKQHAPLAKAQGDVQFR
jgi:hypothetical protein